MKRKENDLPNLHDEMFQPLIFRGVTGASKGEEGGTEAIGFCGFYSFEATKLPDPSRHGGNPCTSFILERMWGKPKKQKILISIFEVFSNAEKNNIHVNWENTCMTTHLGKRIDLKCYEVAWVILALSKSHFCWTKITSLWMNFPAIFDQTSRGHWAFRFHPFKSASKKKWSTHMGKTLSGWKKWRGRRKSTPAWMSRWKCWDQRLGSVGWNPNIHHLLSRLYPIDPNHSLTSWDIQVHSLKLTVRSCQEYFSNMKSWFPTIRFQVCVSFRESIHWMCWIHI